MLGVSMMVKLGVFDVCLVHQTSWTWCPYSSLHSQRTWIWPDCLMVLKGIVFGLFLPFVHQMVLKGGAVMTYGLQVSSVPSVDSAVGGLDHVGSFTF